MNGNLFIVATPIGNLGDITLRALETLKSVDFILCEDTRVSKNLLDHYSIQKPLISYHHHSDARKIREIKTLLAEGKSLALVSDAGTPGISDPGNELINVILSGAKNLSRLDLSATPQDEILKITPIPGPSAAVAALSISGFKTDKFVFLGFPPHKTKRQKFFKEVAAAEHTVVFYESSHRILKCIAELAELLHPKRELVVCRELTKKFETLHRGTIDGISKQKIDERGEFVIVVNALK